MYYVLIPVVLLILTLLDCRNIREEFEDEKMKYDGYIERLRKEMIFQNLENE